MAGPRDPGAAPSRLPRPPLADRHETLSRFRTLLTTGGGGIVLVGPAGSGRTRLAEELLVVADGLGMASVFVRGRATMDDLPLGPFAAFLPPTDERGTPGVHVDGVSLLVLARQALEQRAAGGRLVLGVDDVHLLDPASAALVNQLVCGGSVTLVATIVDGGRAPDPIAQLERDGLVERWSVGPLGHEAVVHVAEALLGGPVAPEVGDELVRLSGGNALFVTTLVRALGESSGPGLDGQLDIRAPVLVDFVAARLRVLEPSERDGLAAVALAEPIGIDVMGALVDRAVLAELERGGWIEVTTSGRRTEVQLAHRLFGEVLRSNVSRLLARTVARELLHEVLDRHGARRHDDVLRVADWSLECGVPIPPERMTAAMREAVARDQRALAGRLADAIWDNEPSFDAGMALLASGSRGGTDDRDGFVSKLRACATEPSQLAQLTTTLSLEPFWRDGDLTATLAELDRAIAELPAGDARDEVLAQRAGYLVVCGRLTEARALLDRLAASTTPAVRSRVAYAERHLATVFGDGRDILARFEELTELTRRLPAPALGLDLWTNIAGFARTLVQNAEVSRAEALLREGLKVAAGVQRLSGRLEHHLALTLIYAGRPGEAVRWAERSVAVRRRNGYTVMERSSLALLALALALTGDVERARATLALIDAAPPNPLVIDAGDRWLARAVVARSAGEPDEAQAVVRDAIASSTDPERPYDLALAWHQLTRLGRAHESAAPLRALGDRLGGLPALYADEARSRAEGDPSGLADVAERYATAGLVGNAHHAAADAAQLHLRAGRSRDAARASRRAGQLATELNLACGQVDELAPEPLSRREREVAELAATGRTTRGIAAELYVSTRTVDNHLARVYEKLGIRGRTELAIALADAESTHDGEPAGDPAGG